MSCERNESRPNGLSVSSSSLNLAYVVSIELAYYILNADLEYLFNILIVSHLCIPSICFVSGMTPQFNCYAK